MGPFVKKRTCTLALVASLLCPLTGVWAQTSDGPFDLDSGNWVSSGKFQDDASRRAAVAPMPTSVQKAADSANVLEGTSAAPSAKTAPNKGFEVTVSSTEDKRAAASKDINSRDLEIPPAAHVAKPEIHLTDKNWKTPAVGSDASKAQSDEDEDGDSHSLNVRMTYLPTSGVKPIPSPAHVSPQKQAHIFARPNTESVKAAPAKTPEESSAIAALNALKKQQLDAIQSDRETLKSLQDAIHSLGLSKQLNFLSDRTGSLSASNNDPAPSASDPTTTSYR